MSKSTTNTQETKKENTMKDLKETIKTIVITVFVTATVAFAGGVVYERSTTERIHAEAKALSSLNEAKK